MTDKAANDVAELEKLWAAPWFFSKSKNTRPQSENVETSLKELHENNEKEQHNVQKSDNENDSDHYVSTVANRAAFRRRFDTESGERLPVPPLRASRKTREPSPPGLMMSTTNDEILKCNAESVLMTNQVNEKQNLEEGYSDYGSYRLRINDCYLSQASDHCRSSSEKKFRKGLRNILAKFFTCAEESELISKSRNSSITEVG